MRAVRGAHAGLLGVFYNAHDFNIGFPVVARAGGQMHAEGIPLGEKLFDHRSVDDGHFSAGCRVSGIEFAPGEQRHAHRGKIIGADGRQVHVAVVAFKVFAAFNGDVGAHVRTGEDREFRGAQGLDAGDCREAFAELVNQQDGPGRVVSAELRSDSEGDDVFRMQAEILFAEIPQRLREQRGTGKKQKRKSHLARYENFAEAHVTDACGNRRALIL